MKNVIMIALMLATGVAAMAQNRELLTPEEQALLATDQMKTEGMIREEQFDQVYEINLATAQKRNALQEEMKAFMENQRAKRKQLEGERMEKPGDVLSDEQMGNLKIKRARQKT